MFLTLFGVFLISFLETSISRSGLILEQLDCRTTQTFGNSKFFMIYISLNVYVDSLTFTYSFIHEMFVIAHCYLQNLQFHFALHDMIT